MKNTTASTQRRVWTVMVIAVAAILVAGGEPAWGQTNREINGAIQFNFAPPGARSLAMGGAFIGRADDATAAYTNPAGLIWISRPEIAVEGRYTTYETQYLNGRLDGTSTGQGKDTVDGLFTSSNSDSVSNLSFLSVALPTGNNYRLAFYRHELANLRASIEDNQRAFFHSERINDTAHPGGLDSSIDLQVIDYGLSTAFRFTENFWAGVGAIYRQFKLDSVARDYFPLDQQGTMYGDIVFSAENQVSYTTQYGDESGFSFNAGLFIKSSNDKWTGGIAYQHSTEFDYALLTSVRPDPQGPLCNPVCPQPAPDLTGTGTFTIPKNIGVGISFSPGDAWMLSLQYNRITYSDLTPDLNSLGELVKSETGFRTGNFIYLEDFDVKDADELHFGIEYVFLGSTPIALRAGAWYEPDHQLRYVEAGRGDSGLTADQIKQLADARKKLNIRFPGGEDQIHYTGGIGAVFGESFQLEAAFDIADKSTIYSLSGVFRF